MQVDSVTDLESISQGTDWGCVQSNYTSIVIVSLNASNPFSS